MPLERQSVFTAEEMKHLPLHTLVLLAVFLHSGSYSDGAGRCVPLFVRVGEEANITCIIQNSDQDGVYLYRQQDENKKESVLYYYKEGQLTVEDPFKGRVKTNENFSRFTVSILNVSESDGGVYWCTFNKLDKNTNSERTCVLGTIEIRTKESECHQIKCHQMIYLGVIGGLSLITLFLVTALVMLCSNRGNYTPKQQQPSNGVYEVMRGHTTKALINPAYESSRRYKHTDSS
ncbi:uncharacterized protein LOC132884701 [Neoarius graeffei]|uniref:uncharacterized protein LOC132884701 n=1 Tax=Neoarius graeffei TaxID=443677 RepID=UPI00298C7C46|nr:uncharacterized protein LOC132884701 [Neoarius graeffei]XP_060774556.1 uncharacterized protein LOC132884701 [Neoarius graeffei]